MGVCEKFVLLLERECYKFYAMNQCLCVGCYLFIFFERGLLLF